MANERETRTALLVTAATTMFFFAPLLAVRSSLQFTSTSGLLRGACLFFAAPRRLAFLASMSHNYEPWHAEKRTDSR